MNQRSAGSFCSLVVATTTGTSDSVTSIDVAAVGNGAELYCVANSAVYRYNSSSAQTTVGDTFIAPTTGGGCWFKQNAQADYAQSIQGTINLITNATPSGARVWTAFPAVVLAYTFPQSSLLWLTTATTTGRVQYLGPTGKLFLVTAQISIESPASEQIQIDIDTNSALQGTTTDTFSPAQAQVPPNGSAVPHSRILSATHNAFYQHVFRSEAGSPGALTFLFYQASFVAL